MDFTKQIKEAMKLSQERYTDIQMECVEDMIPRMDDSKYTNKKLDLAYGTQPYEKLDIFYPDKGDAPYPVFIEIHGGAWYFGQKCSVEFEPFLVGREEGFACVSLGYTLSPHAYYPTAILEIKEAIRYLRVHAEELKLDPNRIVLWGGSAGAHLAALVATSCDTGYLEGRLATAIDKNTYSDEFIGKISAKPNVLLLWYGCFDFYHNGRDLDNWIYQNFFGVEDLSTVEEELRLSSPLEHLTKDTCPTFLQHGLCDQVVPYSQSVAYFEKLNTFKDRNCDYLELVPNCDHADKPLFTNENIQKNFAYAKEQLAKINS